MKKKLVNSKESRMNRNEEAPHTRAYACICEWTYAVLVALLVFRTLCTG